MKYFKDLTDIEIEKLEEEDFVEIMLNEDVTEFNKNDLKFTTRFNHFIILTLLGIITSQLGFQMFGFYILLSFIPSIILGLLSRKSYNDRACNNTSLNLDIYLAKSSGIIDKYNYFIVEKYLDRMETNENFIELFIGYVKNNVN